MEKTLIILRHAKAEAGEDDHARRLAERGIKEAGQMGAAMVLKGIRPQKILCSTSARTRETFREVKAVYPALPEAEYLDALYNASENQLLQVIAEQPAEFSSLMVIAHNPGLHQLALKLSREGDAPLLRKLTTEFPTCALVVVDLGDIAWCDIGKTRGTLKNFLTPKTL